jgi:hypothetical protein
MDALPIQWELRSPGAVFDGYPLRNHSGNLCYPKWGMKAYENAF